MIQVADEKIYNFLFALIWCLFVSMKFFREMSSLFLDLCNIKNISYFLQGFWYFAEKKAKFRGIFRGKFAEKSEDFAGFSREKSQNSQNNRPSSGNFRGRKVKIHRKIGPFRGISAGKKSNFVEQSADFAGF